MHVISSQTPSWGDSALDTAGELLRVLGAPKRLAIVLELSEGSRCVHELVEALGISQSLTSQHLRILRAAGLVVGDRRGREMAYSLADQHVAHIARDALAHGSEPRPPIGDTQPEIGGRHEPISQDQERNPKGAPK